MPSKKKLRYSRAQSETPTIIKPTSSSSIKLEEIYFDEEPKSLEDPSIIPGTPTTELALSSTEAETPTTELSRKKSEPLKPSKYILDELPLMRRLSWSPKAVKTKIYDPGDAPAELNREYEIIIKDRTSWPGEIQLELERSSFRDQSKQVFLKCKDKHTETEEITIVAVKKDLDGEEYIELPSHASDPYHILTLSPLKEGIYSYDIKKNIYGEHHQIPLADGIKILHQLESKLDEEKVAQKQREKIFAKRRGAITPPGLTAESPADPISVEKFEPELVPVKSQRKKKLPWYKRCGMTTK